MEETTPVLSPPETTEVFLARISVVNNVACEKLKSEGYNTLNDLISTPPSAPDLDGCGFNMLQRNKILQAISRPPSDINQLFIHYLGFNPTVSLEEALRKTLNTQNLILDEIQIVWELDHYFLERIIQIVDSIKPRPQYQLILVGTPVLGKVDVSFEQHTSGRLTKFVVSSFSGIEIYSILKKLVPDLYFDVFLSLWSCFDGIPFSYEVASYSSTFTFDSYQVDSLINILLESVTLQVTELEWIMKSKNGYPVKDEEKNDETLLRLKELGILIQSNNNIYIRDKIINSYVLASNDDLSPTNRLEALRGYGLETLTKSVAKYIFQWFSLEQPEDFDVIARGQYGQNDIDCVYHNRTTELIVFFSCKVNPCGHTTKFLNNIDIYYRSIKPKKMILFLCSPNSVPPEVLGQFISECNRYNFSWNPYFKIEVVNLSQVVEHFAQYEQFLSIDNKWPILNRIKVKNDLRLKKFPLLHIIGRRRVGKTTLVQEMFPSAIYVDFKLLEQPQRLKRYQ